MSPISNRLTFLAADIRAAHGEIQTAAADLAELTLAAGRMLVEAKAALPHGEWGTWLEAHTGISSRTARRYMQLVESGLKTATVAEMGIRGAAASLAKQSRKRDDRLALLDQCNAVSDQLLTELRTTGPYPEADAASAEINGRCLLGEEHDAIVQRHLSPEQISYLAEWTYRWEAEVSPLIFEYERRFGWTGGGLGAVLPAGVAP